MNLIEYLTRQKHFSVKVFGPGTRLNGILDHIRKEMVEVETTPSDVKEWIDIVILAFDGAMRAGHSPKEVVAAMIEKQEENICREWPDWKTLSPDVAIEHIKNGGIEK